MIRPGALAIADDGFAWPESRPKVTAEIVFRCHCGERLDVSTERAPVACACGCRYTITASRDTFVSVLSVESHDGARFDVTIGPGATLWAPFKTAPAVLGGSVTATAPI